MDTKINTVNFTHKGWFLLCPIYVSETFSNNPVLIARHRWLEHFFTLNEFIDIAINNLCSFVNPEFQPYSYIKITGEVDVNYKYTEE